MPKYLKKIVYFNKHNEDLFYLIENKDFSGYVCDLIRKDVGGVKVTQENNQLNEINRKLDLLNNKIEKGAVINTVPIMEEVTEDLSYMNDIF